MSQRISGVCVLTHLGVIRAQGEEAVSFLQGQLTNDVALQPTSQARLAAWCSAKGRMLASFVVLRLAPDDLLLLCSRDLLAPTLKRLGMFVLRSRVRLSDASDTFVVHGLVGDAARAVDGVAAWEVLRDASTVDAGTALAEVITVALPAASALWRALRVAPAGTPPPDAPALDEASWLWIEVQSGVARVQATVVDAFVPQMLNYESVDGIHFRKGCYPGQEVVARSQYRGTLKRRMALFALEDDVDAAPSAATELFHSEDPSQPAGLVVNAVCRVGASPQCLLLAEVKLAAQVTGTLHLGSPEGPVLHPRTLPYRIPTESEM